MDDRLIAALIGLGFAAILGFIVARRSEAEEPIHAGTAARAIHYFAVSAISGVGPAVLSSVILGNGIRFSFPLGIGFLAVGWSLLLVFAAIERPAAERAKRESRGWTEADARSSGL